MEATTRVKGASEASKVARRWRKTGASAGAARVRAAVMAAATVGIRGRSYQR